MNARAQLREIDRADAPLLGVLSASGRLAASDEERKFVCLLSDGQLLIAQGRR
jgi:hypothetical protein